MNPKKTILVASANFAIAYGYIFARAISVEVEDATVHRVELAVIGLNVLLLVCLVAFSSRVAAVFLLAFSAFSLAAVSSDTFLDPSHGHTLVAWINNLAYVLWQASVTVSMLLALRAAWRVQGKSGWSDSILSVDSRRPG